MCASYHACKILIDDYIFQNCNRLHKELSSRGSNVVSSVLDQIMKNKASCSVKFMYEAKLHLWEELHKVHWKDTIELDRECFGIVSCIIATNLLRESKIVREPDVVQLLDCGMLLGSERTHKLTNQILLHTKSEFDSLHPVRCVMGIVVNDSVYGRRIAQSQHRLKLLTAGASPEIVRPIKVCDSLALYSFYSNYLSLQLPVVIQNCMEDWKAMQPLCEEGSCTNWGSLTYLSNRLGHRTVPIETGSTYLGEDSGSCFISGNQFISHYILGHTANSSDNQTGEATPLKEDANGFNDRRVRARLMIQDVSNNKSQSESEREGDVPSTEKHCDLPMGYLAQHQLLEQVPELRRDIITPDYCALLLDVDEDETKSDEAVGDFDDNSKGDVLVNAWLGPIGTVSPLHHDPYYNLLAQATGKRIAFLFS